MPERHLPPNTLHADMVLLFCTEDGAMKGVLFSAGVPAGACSGVGISNGRFAGSAGGSLFVGGGNGLAPGLTPVLPLLVTGNLVTGFALGFVQITCTPIFLNS